MRIGISESMDVKIPEINPEGLALSGKTSNENNESDAVNVDSTRRCKLVSSLVDINSRISKIQNPELFGSELDEIKVLLDEIGIQHSLSFLNEDEAQALAQRIADNIVKFPHLAPAHALEPLRVNDLIGVFDPTKNP